MFVRALDVLSMFNFGEVLQFSASAISSCLGIYLVYSIACFNIFPNRGTPVFRSVDHHRLGYGVSLELFSSLSFPLNVFLQEVER